MKADKFLKALKDRGFDFFTGVPCSYFTTLCDLLADSGFDEHIPAVREDQALGLACGAYLAGKLPVLYMQNSGLGYSLEAFASLPLIYHIPCLVLVSYRGPDDPGMEEHRVMGEHTEEILHAFKIEYSVFSGDPGEPDLDKIKTYLQTKKLPYVILFKKGALQ